MAYWRLHYHAVWTCKNRRPLITTEVEAPLHEYLRKKGAELGGIMHAVGGIENHVHIVFSLPPKISIADFIGKLKGASSHLVTHVLQCQSEFDWQRGYGVLSFNDGAMTKIITYALNQKEHHHKNTIRASFEKWSEEDNGVGVYRNDMSASR